MKIFEIFSVLCLLISIVIDVSEAECGEYFVVLEENICPDGTHYTATPLKKENIIWDNVTYPCGSTVTQFGKECLVEFNYESEPNTTCLPAKNNQNHISTAGYDSEKSSTPSPNVTVKPNQNQSNKKMSAPMVDVNLNFINENNIPNSPDTGKTTQNETMRFVNAKIFCFDELKHANEYLCNIKNDTHNTELESTLLILIDRDETSSIQPIFTGYFSTSNDSSKNYKGNFKDLKTVSIECSITKHYNCKENIQINMYIEVNYIENNTITKYPNCIQNMINSENVINIKCEDVLFAKHNQHIYKTDDHQDHANIKNHDNNTKIPPNKIFNRKKDISNYSSGQESLGGENVESERTILIALLAMVGVGILAAVAWRMWPKKTEYNPTPTREPDEEETAF
ncbi:hypothetical protein PYW08_001843 [Mythimna loreyi]|uniref:Uncharacterized protein n=1 Tax=Mythimna loreyi TaxID=667449 RepID=A0ACC2R7U5_9NEOP|nr:hypothetical protein PYW08_001843 [Mythimna loreyi]